MAIHGLTLGQKLQDAGILPPNTTRVIIDVPYDGIVKVYFETNATSKLNNIDLAEILKDGFEIVGGEELKPKDD